MVDASDAAGLAASVLDEESQRANEPEPVEPDWSADLLSTDEEIGSPLRVGGPLLIALMLAAAVDDLALAVFTTLAPDIQATLDISDTLIAVTSQLGPLVLALAAFPLSMSADNGRRVSVLAMLTAVGSLAAFAGGAARNEWPLGASRLATGAARGGEVAQHALVADGLPLWARLRGFGLLRAATGLGLLVGPFLAAGVSAAAGGSAGWRWAFVAVGVLGLVAAAVVRSVEEPGRGDAERLQALGDEPLVVEESPGFVTAFVQLRRIRTFNFVVAPLALSGFVLFGFPVFASKLLADEYGLGATDRAYVFGVAALGVIAGSLVAGRGVDQSDASQLCRAASYATAAAAVVAVAPAMPNQAAFGIVLAVGQVPAAAALVLCLHLIATVTPSHLRAQGMALGALYTYGVGAFGGATAVGLIGSLDSGYVGPLVAVSLLAALGATISLVAGAPHIRRDISAVVTDLRSRHAEAKRMEQGGTSAVIQVSNLDFSYGQLQVLFDVNMDVQDGEVLALLGTNGAGKSTLLKVISGLGLPTRGAVRLDGHDITFTEAEERVAAGIVQVPGGKAVFPTLTVKENLTVGAYTYIRDKQRVRERTDYVIELFPKLGERLSQPAGLMSGGEQQMLAIAKGLLLDPKVLCIDELSLGLAPVVVQEILEVVETLREQGITMVIVEQSVNVALSISDRAIFMEKGRIRFQGPAQELMERGDLVRAVFLGGEGG